MHHSPKAYGGQHTGPHTLAPWRSDLVNQLPGPTGAYKLAACTLGPRVQYLIDYSPGATGPRPMWAFRLGAYTLEPRVLDLVSHAHGAHGWLHAGGRHSRATDCGPGTLLTRGLPGATRQPGILDMAE